MPDLVSLLRRLADEYEAEESGEASQAAERARDERIERIEQAIANQARSTERRQALDDLSDEERELILRHRSGSSPAGARTPEDGDEPAADNDDEEEERLPRQRLDRLDVPRIHGGDDEPDIVRYRDEAGKLRTRKGRRRNEPYGFEVTELADDDSEAEETG